MWWFACICTKISTISMACFHQILPISIRNSDFYFPIIKIAKLFTILMTKFFHLGSWYHNVMIIFPPWPVNHTWEAYQPPGRYAPAVCGPWLTGQGHQKVVYFNYAVAYYTTATVIIMLGFMTFGVWHERDSGKGGGGRQNILTAFSNERAQKWGAKPNFVLNTKWDTLPKQEIS